jgi:hypothetical protein
MSPAHINEWTKLYLEFLLSGFFFSELSRIFLASSQALLSIAALKALDSTNPQLETKK